MVHPTGPHASSTGTKSFTSSMHVEKVLFSQHVFIKEMRQAKNQLFQEAEQNGRLVALTNGCCLQRGTQRPSGEHSDQGTCTPLAKQSS